MNQNEYIEEILSGIDNVFVSPEVDSLLSNLVNTKSKIFDIKTNNSTAFFYDILTPWVRSNEITYLQNDDISIPIIKECVRWLFNNWKQLATIEKFSDSIVAYSLLDYFHLPYDCLRFEDIDHSYKSKIEKVIETFDLTMSIPDVAGYSDKKTFEVYHKNISEKKWNKVISFLDHFWGYEGLNIFYRSLVKISVILCPKAVAKLLGSSEVNPLLTKAVLDVLDEDCKLDFFINHYNEIAIFPVLYFFEKKVGNDQRLIERKELSEADQKTIELAQLLQKIIIGSKSKEPISYLKENLKLSNNNYYCQILGHFIATNSEYAKDYVDTIDFSCSRHSGEYFWRGFVENCTKESDKLVLSQLIEERYYQHCKDEKYLKHHQYTCFLNPIYVSIRSRCNTIGLYRDELISLVTKIKKHICSWDFSIVAVYFHKLYLTISCNAVLLNYVSNDDSFFEVLEFLNDDRLKLVYGVEVHNLLLSCLKNPCTVTNIIASDVSGNFIDLTINRVVVDDH